MALDFNYKVYNNSPATHWMMGLFSSHATGRELRLASKNVTLGERASKMNYMTYSYKSEDCMSELIIQEINKKLPANSQLAMIYVLIVGNQQNWKKNKASFMIEEFIKFKGEEVTKVTREVARRQLEQIMKRLLDCKIEVKYTKRSKRCAMINLLAGYTYDNGFCTVEFPNSVIEALNIYPQLFPNWGGQLSNQKAFAMTIYIYYRIKQARQYNGTINVNVKDLLSYAGIPYEKDHVKNRRYKQLMIQPFLKAIEEIHLLSDETLKIEVQPYSGIDEFLSSHVVIHYDNKVAEYYKSKSKKTGGKLSEPKSSKPSQRVSKRAAR